MKILKHTLLGMTATAVMGTGGAANAALLAYEGFDTSSSDGVNLPTASNPDNVGPTTFGWADQWRWNANTGLGITVDSPGLTYGDLDTVGKLATSNFDGSSAGEYRRELSQAYTIGTGTGQNEEMWVSWLSTWSGNETGGTALQWFKLMDDGSEVIAAGINNWGGVQDSPLVDQWRLAPGDADNPGTSFTGVVAEPDEVYQLAMRLSADGSDTLIELFVNSDGDRDLGSALATHTITDEVTFDHVRLQTQQTNITATWDEIRIGDSFMDVGLIPEPSSLALLGLGGLLMLRRRRD